MILSVFQSMGTLFSKAYGLPFALMSLVGVKFSHSFDFIVPVAPVTVVMAAAVEGNDSRRTDSYIMPVL